MSGLLEAATTSSLILTALKEVILMTTRRIDPAIIFLIEDQRRHQLRIHTVDLERYTRRMSGMELQQKEIEAGNSSIKLAYTWWRLLSPAAMVMILADPEKGTASVKITVTSVEDRDIAAKNSVWVSGRHDLADHFTDISPDIL